MEFLTKWNGGAWWSSPPKRVTCGPYDQHVGVVLSSGVGRPSSRPEEPGVGVKDRMKMFVDEWASYGYDWHDQATSE